MKGLVGYHLLNAAAFQNSSCAVNGHFQYIGTNGNGKTTNLRIPLYFYNPSGQRADHAIEQSKRPFNDFYFRGLHSFIIFEICRGKFPDGTEDRYHIAVNRKGGRPPCFIFIDAPFNIDFYASTSGKICNEKELIQNLYRRGISSHPVNGYGDFRGIIYGTHTNERSKPYVYAIPKHSAIKSIDTIPRILSSIFRSETMKTETLKDALIASLGIEDEQLSIDLHNTGKELKQFNSKRRDVQNIESMLGQLKVLVDDFRSYENSKTAMHSLACKIKSALPKVELAIETSSAAVLTAKQEITKVTDDFALIEQNLEDEKTNLDQELGALNQKRSDIKTHQKEYPEEQILKWEHAEQELPKTKTTLIAYEEELEILNQRFADIETKYKRLENRLESTFTDRKQNQRSAIGKKETALRDEVNSAHENLRKLLTELEKSSRARKHELTTAQSESSERCSDLKNALDRLELAQFRKPEIQGIQLELKELSEKQKNNDHALKTMPDKAKLLEQAYELRRNELAKKYEDRLDEQRAQLDNLQIKINNEQPLVERYQDSLLDYADQQNLSSEALRSIVREEILLMPVQDVLRDGHSPKDSLLGLQINLEALPPAPDLNFEQAKLRLEELQKDYLTQSGIQSEIEEAYRKAQNEAEVEHNTQFETQRVQLNKLRGESTTLATEIETQTRALESEQSQQSQEYQATSEKITRDHLKAVADLEEANEQINKFEDEQNKRNQKIETEAKEAIHSAEAKIVVLHETLKDQLDKLEQSFQKEKSQLLADKQNELKSGSSNPEQLESIKRLHSQTEKQLEALEDQVKDLKSYRKHVLPQIKQLPEVLEKLEGLSQHKIKIESDRDKLKEQKRIALSELSERLKEHEELFNEAQADAKAYQYWSKAFPRHAVIEENSLLTTYKPGDLKSLDTRFRDESTASENLWNGTKGLETTDYRNLGIARSARKIIKPFSTNNLYGFPDQLESDIEIEEFIQKKVEPLIATDVIERERKQILNAFHLTMKNLAREYSDMERYKSQLQKTLNGVQRSITGKKIFVSAIENIEFRMEPSKSKLGTLRDNLKSCIDKLETLDLQGSAQDDLFRRHPDSREIQILLDQVQTLCNEISDHKIDRISLGDLFEMQIRITENGNIHPWKSSIHGIGSEGTDTLAKVMIYVGILSHFKNSAFKNADELHLHCLVDEIGRIHSDYISELLHYCNVRGIFLATASPETHRRPGDFQSTYLIERSADQRHAKIQKVLQVGVSVA